MRKLICLIIVAFSLFTSSALTWFTVRDPESQEVTYQWVNHTDRITIEQEETIQSVVTIALLNGTMELKRGHNNEYLVCGNIAKNRRFVVKVSKEDWDYFKTWVLR